METEAKKVPGKKRVYTKKTPTFVTLNVDNHLAAISNREDQNYTWNLLLRYLRDHRKAEFYSLDDIAKALKNEYRLDDTKLGKSTMSKAIARIRGDLIFNDGTYYFEKIDKVYKLRPRYSKDDPLLINLFKLRHAFIKNSVYCINSNTFVFTVHAEWIDRIKDGFGKFLGNNLCYGIMACDQYIVIMLNGDHSKAASARLMLNGFFERKSKYEEERRQQRMAEQRMKKRDKAIREERRKKKKYDLSKI